MKFLHVGLFKFYKQPSFLKIYSWANTSSSDNRYTLSMTLMHSRYACLIFSHIENFISLVSHFCNLVHGKNMVISIKIYNNTKSKT